MMICSLRSGRRPTGTARNSPFNTNHFMLYSNKIMLPIPPPFTKLHFLDDADI